MKGHGFDKGFSKISLEAINDFGSIKTALMKKPESKSFLKKVRSAKGGLNIPSSGFLWLFLEIRMPKISNYTFNPTKQRAYSTIIPYFFRRKGVTILQRACDILHNVFLIALVISKHFTAISLSACVSSELCPQHDTFTQHGHCISGCSGT